MTPADYTYLCDLLKQRSGLVLDASKNYLVDSRLTPLAQSYGLAGLSELVQRLRTGRDERLAVAVTEAMTTNETLFFRDTLPFEELSRIVLPRLLEARRNGRRLRFWSAACSTGQEPYSIAMLLHDQFPQLRNWSIEIVATDLSTQALNRARAGEYSVLEVQRGLPTATLVQHFDRTESGYRIKPALRQGIQWRQLNLQDPLSSLGIFDVIFCRNVLIYFDVDGKRRILNNIRRQMPDDGCLILGAAETALGLTPELERHRECRSAMWHPRLTTDSTQRTTAVASTLAVAQSAVR